MVRLNGWMRLWIVCCIVLEILVLLPVQIRLFPFESKVDREYQDTAAAFHRLMVYKENPNLMPPDFNMGEFKNQTVKEVFAASVKAGQDYEQRLRNLKYAQVGTVVFSLLIWVVACLALLFVGKVGAWIVRGFRPSEGSSS